MICLTFDAIKDPQMLRFALSINRDGRIHEPQRL